MLHDIDRYIRHYRAQLPSETEQTGRIYIRMADIFDAFDDDPGYTTQVLKLLGASPITGILYEDVRGSRFTFESNALVRLMRRYVHAPRKILAHPHSGNGMEDAATIEAVVAGADGVWSGFTPQAAQGGHGSALMFLTNLVRAGNPHVQRLYQLEKLVEVARRMWQIHDRHDVEPNQPVVGERAYRYVDQYFEQSDLPCDLDPELIGAQAGYEIMPAWAPTYVIGKRLEELGYESEVCTNRALLRRIRALINEAQMDGRHVRFDNPDELAPVVEQARTEVAAHPEDDQRAEDHGVLSLRRG
jgi:isopropylmalate/homocitrate/citramalate synthase